MRTNASSKPGLDAADLLAEAGWLRSLALRLVRDEAEADDLVQETWRRALQRPPRDSKALPAWLARVARNTAAEDRRRRARRRAREIRAARPDRVPAADEIVARTEMHRVLVEALLKLDEPFRSTLLLRYFDDLTPKEIAKRLGRDGRHAFWSALGDRLLVSSNVTGSNYAEEARVGGMVIDDISAGTVLSMLVAPYGLRWNAVGKTLWIGTADQILPPR